MFAVLRRLPGPVRGDAARGARRDLGGDRAQRRGQPRCSTSSRDTCPDSGRVGFGGRTSRGSRRTRFAVWARALVPAHDIFPRLTVFETCRSPSCPTRAARTASGLPRGASPASARWPSSTTWAWPSGPRTRAGASRTAIKSSSSWASRSRSSPRSCSSTSRRRACRPRRPGRASPSSSASPATQAHRALTSTTWTGLLAQSTACSTGRIIAEARPEEIRGHVEVKRVYLGEGVLARRRPRR